MIRLLMLCLLVIAPAMALAQEGPVLSMEVKEVEAVPGQPLTVRVTVLVPTFMPSPPVWPSYEAPNLLVRLPEKSTSPTSQRVDGETWAGITRRYQISPMIPGQFVLPEAEVIVTWADPDTNEPIKTTLRTEAVTLTGILPEGAETLDPFIAATGLELSAEVQGTPDALVPGDSVVRVVTAKIEGTSPMFLPPLSPMVEVQGLRVYADEPVMEIKDNRGELSGTRSEKVTFLAQSGGAGSVPGVSLQWYNLDSGKIETASINGFDIAIDGPVAVADSADNRRRLILMALAGVVALAGLAVLWWLLRAPVSRWRAVRKAAWLASERFAWRDLQRAIRAQDMQALYRALELWAGRVEGPDPRAESRMNAALLALGQARYGEHPSDAVQGWAALENAVRAVRSDRHAGQEAATGLPRLN